MQLCNTVTRPHWVLSIRDKFLSLFFPCVIFFISHRIVGFFASFEGSNNLLASLLNTVGFFKSLHFASLIVYLECVFTMEESEEQCRLCITCYGTGWGWGSNPPPTHTLTIRFCNSTFDAKTTVLWLSSSCMAFTLFLI